MKRLLLLLLLATSIVRAQDISIIPQPATLKTTGGYFVFNSSTTIGIPSKQPEVAKLANNVAASIRRSTGLPLPVIEGTGTINLSINASPNQALGAEGYTLDVSSSKIDIVANKPAGLFYGLLTVLQLLPPAINNKTIVAGIEWKVPGVSVIDYPRFGWRGLMLDVSRHFFSKEYVKDFIDRMAMYKYNRFHWHLTDDQGWRVEIKSYPKLTQIGSLRVPRTGTFGSNKEPQPGEAATDGGFYTQDDIREIVQYAKDRYVEILPEIDVPGHSMAAVASYPELSVTKDPNTKVSPGSKFSTWYGNGKFSMEIDNNLNPVDENVYVFLDKVFGEIATLFPFEYIHMGGDECYKGYWEKDPSVQAFMKKNNIKDGQALQAYFNKRVNKIINDKKKKMIGWDEILEGGISDNAAVMSWRGVKGGIEATHLKHQVVMSPAPIWYLDMMQGDVTTEAPVYNTARLKDVYAFDIIAPGIDSAYVLGGQGNLWTEQIAIVPQSDYMLWPRGFAVAEGLWSPKSRKDWMSFVNRVENHFDRFDAAGVNYSPAMYDPIIRVTKNDKGLLVVELTSEIPGADIYCSFDNSAPGKYHPKYSAPVTLSEDADIFRCVAYRNGKQISRIMTIKTEDLAKRVRK